MQRTFNGLRAIITVSLIIASVAAFGQSRPTWETAREIQADVRGSMNGTVTSLDSTRNTMSITADGDSPGTPVRVILDSATARYSGFGSGTSVQKGSTGFTQMRVGDRVQVIGTGRPNLTIAGTEVVLLGRSVASPTPTPARAPVAANTEPLPPDTIEGVVRSVNTKANSFVLETDQRDLYTVTGTANTPVYYNNQTFRISNIEEGDRLRVRFESRTNDGVRARSISVVGDATPDAEAPGGRTVTSVTGRVTRIDTRAQTMRIDIGRGREVRVDLVGARDSEGRGFRTTDLQVGDRVELSGSYISTDQFKAATVRFVDSDSPLGDAGIADVDDDDGERIYETVVIYGTVQAVVTAGNVLRVRDSSADREYDVNVVDDFIVRLQNGNYVTADQLKQGDRVVVQAFRDGDDNLIAQTIRTR